MNLGLSVVRVHIPATPPCSNASVAFVGHSFNPIVPQRQFNVLTCYKPKVYLTQGGLLIVFHGPTHQVQPHQQRSDSRAPPPPPQPPSPTFLLLVLFERIRRGSITCRALRVVAGGLARQAQASAASSLHKRVDGRGGFGRGGVGGGGFSL